MLREAASGLETISSSAKSLLLYLLALLQLFVSATPLLTNPGLTQIEASGTTYSVMVGYAHPTKRGYA
jgi:hypothetical protein